MSALILLQACGNSSNKQIQSISWLLGEWVTTSSSGMTTKEKWETDGNIMSGMGWVQKEGDTTFVENLTIKMVNDTLTYLAETPGNNDVVGFKLTSNIEGAWTFENQKHDFPKMIKYHRISEDEFKAVVSGGDRSFTLNFKKN
ncbi:MAG: hypothetical protein JXQ96_07660 [Cyclobacteriaceae bacterium]